MSEPLTDTEASEGSSNYSSVSADGRYVAFDSNNAFLVTPDANPGSDIFVYDRKRDAVELVSVSSSGLQGLGISSHPSISASGRYVAFVSEAHNLVEGDTNLVPDVFVHDRKNSTTERFV